MSKLPTIKTILSGFFSTAALNANFVALRDAFNNTLSRDGSTPNTMNADIDLNGNDLLNVGTLTAQDLTVAGVDLTLQESIAEVNLKADEAAASALSAANSAAAAQAAENSLLEWAGPWLTSTTYAPSDLVQEDGSTYVCVIAHTSGTFATDYGAGKWQLFASKGSAGAGTGDMLAANNLSDLADADTALTNLGGTVVGKAVFKAADAAAGQTALGLGSLATKNEVTASEIAAAALVTAADTIASNNNDTTIPTSAAVKAYVDGTSAPVLQVFTASGTWTKPTGYSDDTMVTVEMWGGGGGGNYGGTLGTTSCGAGGAYASKRFRLADLPASVSVTVGAGGTGRTGSAGNGTPGGNSTFGTLLTAFGGAGGRDTAFSGGGGELAAGTNGSGGKVGGGNAAGGDALTAFGGGAGAHAGTGAGGNAVFGGGGGGFTAGGGLSAYGGNGGTAAAGLAPGGGGAGRTASSGYNGARGEVRVLIG